MTFSLKANVDKGLSSTTLVGAVNQAYTTVETTFTNKIKINRNSHLE
jgi:hypothetical protein